MAAPWTAATTGVCASKRRAASPVEVGGVARPAPAAAPLAAGEVGAGAEVLALRAQHDGAGVGPGVDELVGVGQIADEIDVEVVVGRAVDLDGRDQLGVDRDGHVTERVIRTGHPCSLARMGGEPRV